MVREIELPMDMSNVQISNSDLMAFDKSEPLTTVFFFYLHAGQVDYWTEETSFVYEGFAASVRNSVIDKPENDPYFKVLSTMTVGVNIQGIDTLSLMQLSDHKGQYPTWATEISIQGNVSNWKQPYIKPDEILGPPPNMDKVFALKIWAEAARRNADTKILGYDDVTLFFIRYFRSNGMEKCWIANALTSNTAYRRKVREYLLDQQVLDLLERLDKTKPRPEIGNESDLFTFVNDRIREVFTLHVEYRRWIEAFWNGTRTVKVDSSEIRVPAEPKGETQIQPTIHVLLYEMFVGSGIQVVRESDEGIGNLDFRLLFTTKDGKAISIAIEFKLAHHKRLMHGLHSQLPAYMNATKTNHGLFLVFWFKDKDAQFFKEPTQFTIDETRRNLINEATRVSTQLNKVIEALIVDASIKKSASVD